MKITTKEQAFERLDNNQYGVPFEAIEFLYQHPTDEAIVGKIQMAFDNAYHNFKNTSTEEENDYYGPELWYAVVAENHLDLSLLDPIIKQITEVEDSLDSLDEQISVLIGLMGKKHGSIVVKKVLAAIENSLENKSGKHYPYLYLFDILFFVDPIQEAEAITRILEHPNNEYFAPFAITLCYAGLKEFVPKIKELIQLKDKSSSEDFFEFDYLIPELEEDIKKLESGQLKDSKNAVPYFEQRGPWKAYYQEIADLFEEISLNDDFDDVDFFPSSSFQRTMPVVNDLPKVGRNEPCPCGSGKKYKKCCLKKK